MAHARGVKGSFGKEMLDDPFGGKEFAAMAMPGLKIFLQGIDKPVLKEFFDGEEPFAGKSIDWKLTGRELAEKIYALIAELRHGNIKAFDGLYSRFSDINILSEKAKDAIFYRKKVFENRALKEIFLKTFGVGMPTVNTLSMWIALHSPDVFKELLTRKFSSQREATGGVRYYLPSNYDGSISADLNAFRDDVKRYLKDERGYAIRVHVERNDLVGLVRFTVAMDPVPKKEAAFDEGGGDDDLGMSLARGADFFYVTLKEGSPRKQTRTFAVKGDFLKTQRDMIAKLFASDVLGSRMVPKPEVIRDLASFVKRPPKFDIVSSEPDFRNLEYRGVKMEIESGGERPELYMRRFNGNLYDEIARRGELKGVPDEAKRILELYLEVSLLPGNPPSARQMTFANECEDGRKEKVYEVAVPACGEWRVKPAATAIDEAKIARVLSAMGIVNVAGDKVLKKTVRK